MRRAVRGLFGAVLHPSLKDQDCGHTVDSLAPLLDGKIGLPQEAVGLGRGQAFIPKMDWKLEMFAEIVGKSLNLLGLDAFRTAHAKRQANYDFFDAVVADDAMKKGKIVFLVLAVEGVQTLRGDAERVRDGHPDAAGANVEAENAVCGAFVGHRRDYRAPTLGLGAAFYRRPSAPVVDRASPGRPARLSRNEMARA